MSSPAAIGETIRGIADGTVGYEDGLDALTVAPAAVVDAALDEALHQAFGRLFRGGWQPAELHRVIARRGNPHQGDIVAAEAVRAAAAEPTDPRWRAQAAELPASGRRADRVTRLDARLGLLAELRALPPIEVLMPPPGTAPATPGGHGTADTRVLDRVRALLAKAESTDFPAEAEAFSAKAQELIARHSIEEALTARDRAEVVPFARRIGVDHPYE